MRKMNFPYLNDTPLEKKLKLQEKQNSIQEKILRDKNNKIEKILDKKLEMKGKIKKEKYLIKWDDLSEIESTWEFLENISKNVENLLKIKEFEEKQEKLKQNRGIKINYGKTGKTRFNRVGDF